MYCLEVDEANKKAHRPLFRFHVYILFKNYSIALFAIIILDDLLSERENYFSTYSSNY